MVDWLVGVTRRLGLEAAPEDLLDTVWLAAHLGFDPGRAAEGSAAGARATGDGERGSLDREASDGGPERPGPERGASDAETPPASSSHGEDDPPSAGTAVDDDGADTSVFASSAGEGTGRGRRVRVGGVRALKGERELVKALRPITRRAPSRTKTVLDEDATARRIAEERLWLPVVKPQRTRWLDLALVVDVGTSMQAWSPLLKELRGLMRMLGAFDEVRLWRLDTTHAESPVLYGESDATPRNPREVLDPTGRRAVLIATDCVADAWYGEPLMEILRQWRQTMPVAILQMLPPSMWSDTALGNGSRGTAHATRASAPASRLAYRSLSRFFRPQEKPKLFALPVVTLEPGELGSWAKLVAGRGGAEAPAVYLRPAGPTASAPDAEATADERIEAFLEISSPTAVRLAMLLAAAPLLQLPIMRLVQAALLPDSGPLALAEVLTGGLLRRAEWETSTKGPEGIWYDFHPGVRDVLLESASARDAVEVLTTVSEYLSDLDPFAFSISAFVLDPKAPLDAPGTEPGRQFARVAASVLRRAGGPFAAQADALTRQVRRAEATLKGESRVELPNEAIRDVAWSPDGSGLAVAGARGISWIDASGGTPRRLGALPGATAVAFKGSNLVAAFRDGTVRRLARDGEEIDRREIGPGVVRDIDALGEEVFVAHRDGLFVWDLSTGDLGTALGDDPDGVLCLAVTEGQLSLGAAGGFVRTQEAPAEDLKNSYIYGNEPHEARPVSALAYRADGLLAAGYGHGHIRVGDPLLGTLGDATMVVASSVTGLAFSADGRILAVAEESGMVTLWRTDSWQEVARLPCRGGSVYGGAAFHPFLPRLATWEGEGSTVTLDDLDIDALCSPENGGHELSVYVSGSSDVSAERQAVVSLLEALGCRVYGVERTGGRAGSQALFGDRIAQCDAAVVLLGRTAGSGARAERDAARESGTPVLTYALRGAVDRDETVTDLLEEARGLSGVQRLRRFGGIDELLETLHRDLGFFIEGTVSTVETTIDVLLVHGGDGTEEARAVLQGTPNVRGLGAIDLATSGDFDGGRVAEQAARNVSGAWRPGHPIVGVFVLAGEFADWPWRAAVSRLRAFGVLGSFLVYVRDAQLDAPSFFELPEGGALLVTPFRSPDTVGLRLERDLDRVVGDRRPPEKSGPPRFLPGLRLQGVSSRPGSFDDRRVRQAGVQVTEVTGIVREGPRGDSPDCDAVVFSEGIPGLRQFLTQGPHPEDRVHMAQLSLSGAVPSDPLTRVASLRDTDDLLAWLSLVWLSLPLRRADGFLSVRGICDYLLSVADEVVRPGADEPFVQRVVPFLETPVRRGWLVSTARHLYCVLEGEAQWRSMMVQWRLELDKAYPVRVHEDDSTPGDWFVDIGSHLRWLVSSHLHPDPAGLERTIREAIVDSRFGADLPGLGRDLLLLGDEYLAVRASMPSSAERTRAMGGVVQQMRGRVAGSADDEIGVAIAILVRAASPGAHLAAAVALARKHDPQHFGWLGRLLESAKPFVGYHAALALRAAASHVATEHLGELRAVLQAWLDAAPGPRGTHRRAVVQDAFKRLEERERADP